jgi:hypothetical protein
MANKRVFFSFSHCTILFPFKMHASLCSQAHVHVIIAFFSFLFLFYRVAGEYHFIKDLIHTKRCSRYIIQQKKKKKNL